MSDTTAARTESGKPEDVDKKALLHVEQLLGRPAVCAAGKVVVGGKRLNYKTAASFLPVVAPDALGSGADPQAAIMAISYTLDQGKVSAPRPVCFAFNGGPGSASIWLHMGALGPQRVVVPDDASSPKAPFSWEENPDTWLTHFDLVFIDPPHTGWSTTAGEKAKKQVLSVDGDVACLAEAIRLWLTREKRWSSPVYLAGESYGTTRSAALADKLQNMGISLSGLLLISCAMDLQSLVFSHGNHLPYALFLPAFANVSQYHGLLKGSLGRSSANARQAAEEFVREDYLAALHQGAQLSAKRRSQLAQRLAELTGLDSGLIAQKNLRITDQTYFFEAMRQQGQQVGRLDARATGPLAAQQTQQWEFDPSMEAITPAFTMAAMDYFSRGLGLSSDAPYQVLSMEVNKKWKWTRGSDDNEHEFMGFVSTSADLSRAMRKNSNLQVFVASGRYDLGTPYSASDWSLSQFDVSPAVMRRVSHHYYDAGHMMYTRSADRIKMKKDLDQFLSRVPS